MKLKLIWIGLFIITLGAKSLFGTEGTLDSATTSSKVGWNPGERGVIEVASDSWDGATVTVTYELKGDQRQIRNASFTANELDIEFVSGASELTISISGGGGAESVDWRIVPIITKTK